MLHHRVMRKEIVSSGLQQVPCEHVGETKTHTLQRLCSPGFLLPDPSVM